MNGGSRWMHFRGPRRRRAGLPVTSGTRKTRRRVSPMILWVLASTIAGVGLAPHSSKAADETDWNRLRASVVDLDVHHPEGGMFERAYGFCLEGVDGIITCHRRVKGAERVTVRTFKGDKFDVTSYVAHDPVTDLIILDAPNAGEGLARGTHWLIANDQACFVILPPSVRMPPYDQEPYKMRYLGVIAAAGVNDVLAAYGNISPGLPLADSLGQVIGVMEDLREGQTVATCAIPIRKVADLLAKPDPGGLLADLAGEPKAPWTQLDQAEGAQLMGALLCRNQRFAKGLPYLTRAIEQKPQFVEALIEWGKAYQSKNEHDEAERYYRRALELQPTYARGHLYLATNYFVQEQYAKAQEENKAAIALDPSLPLAHVNLGVSCYAQGDMARAMESLRTALEVEPLMGVAHLNLAALLHQQGQTKEAQETLKFLRSQKSGYATRLARTMNPSRR